MEITEQLALNENSWAPITPVEAQTVVGALGEENTETVRILATSHRPMAAAALVDLGSRAVFMKRYPVDMVSVRELQAKHAFVNTLAKTFPAAKMLTFADGGTTFVTDGNIYEVSERAVGEDRYKNVRSWQPPNSVEDARELGHTAAKLRLAAANIPTSHQEPTSFSSPFELAFRICEGATAVREWVRQRPVISAYLHQRGLDFWADLQNMVKFSEQIQPLRAAKPQWSHGDLHVSNTFWDGGHISTVIDFGLATVNPPLADLAIAIERHSIDWVQISAGRNPRSGWPDAAKAILEGYCSQCPLGDEEEDALSALVALSGMEFDLMMVEYAAKIPDPALADWAYNIGFLQHNQWFCSDAGTEYLHFLRATVTK
ncbi:MAG: phosphotransferase [Actinomycetaceae bacterium]|nr:phosphotransferase [Actinomycetaceae bacterium]